MFYIFSTQYSIKKSFRFGQSFTCTTVPPTSMKKNAIPVAIAPATKPRIHKEHHTYKNVSHPMAFDVTVHVTF